MFSAKNKALDTRPRCHGPLVAGRKHGLLGPAHLFPAVGRHRTDLPHRWRPRLVHRHRSNRSRLAGLSKATRRREGFLSSFLCASSLRRPGSRRMADWACWMASLTSLGTSLCNLEKQLLIGKRLGPSFLSMPPFKLEIDYLPMSLMLFLASLACLLPCSSTFLHAFVGFPRLSRPE